MMNSTEVQLYKVDLSNGKARWISPVVFGEKVDAIWHVSIVIQEYHAEFSYNCDVGVEITDINECPDENKMKLGYTSKSPQEICDFLNDLKAGKFHVERYSLFRHNCIHFCECLSNFLVHSSIPVDLRFFPKRMEMLCTKAALVYGGALAFYKILRLIRLARLPCLTLAAGGSAAVLFSPVGIGLTVVPLILPSVGSFITKSIENISKLSRSASSSSENTFTSSSSRSTSQSSRSTSSSSENTSTSSTGSTSDSKLILSSSGEFVKSARPDLMWMYLRCYRSEAERKPKDSEI